MEQEKKLELGSEGQVNGIMNGDQQLSEEELNDLLVKTDSESNFRKDSGWKKYLVDILCAILGIFLLCANYGPPFSISTTMTKIIALALVMALGYLIYPRNRKAARGNAKAMDFLLAIVGAAPCIYLAFNYNRIVNTMGSVGNTTIRVLGLVLVVLLFFLCRRTHGWALPIISLIFMVYALFGRYMPGLFLHKGIPLERLLDKLFLGQDGIFGTPLGTGVSYIFLFVLFGTLLSETGLSDFFNDLACSIAGKASGGPAKVAVISSGLMGMISGSGAVNVCTTGVFTIPMMKKLGYKPYFAGAVEAVASCGGQIMPPVMGAAAFILAEYVGYSYTSVMYAALIPAILYYISCFLMVHQEAKRLGLKGLPPEEIPNYKKVIISQGILILPILLLVVLMCEGKTAKFAVYFSMAALIAENILLGVLSKKLHLGNFRLLTPKNYWDILVRGTKTSLGMMISTAIVGIVVGVISMTGLGLSLANYIVKLAGGNLFFTMLFTAITVIILGMGLPFTPCYIIAATVAAPALVSLGAPKIAAHMFVLYFCATAAFTPPVATAAYAASGICNDSPWKVGYTALRLGVAGYLVPFAFVFCPQLVLVDVNLEIIWICFTAITGIYALCCATIGYLRDPLNIVFRILLFAAGVLCVYPETFTDIVGLAIFGVIFAVSIFKKKPSKVGQT